MKGKKKSPNTTYITEPDIRVNNKGNDIIIKLCFDQTTQNPTQIPRQSRLQEFDTTVCYFMKNPSIRAET